MNNSKSNANIVELEIMIFQSLVQPNFVFDVINLDIELLIVKREYWRVLNVRILVIIRIDAS